MRSTVSAIGCGVGERVGEVRGRVGRRQRDLVAAVNQRERDGGREGRFADPAFAHRHDHAVAGGVELIDQLVKAGEVNRRRTAVELRGPSLLVAGRVGAAR